jgi:methyl-accepting chemotaxis protein
VEAARAGEHGKGFAVVAEEVRNLAQRASKASSETEQLIQETSTRIEHGVSIANTTGEVLGHVGEAVGSTSELMETISRGAQEQSARVRQVLEALEQVDAATQNNAASSEEGAGIAQQLSSAADRLNRTVTAFRLAGSSSPPAGGAPARGGRPQPPGQAAPPRGGARRSAQRSVEHRPETPVDLDDADFSDF